MLAKLRSLITGRKHTKRAYNVAKSSLLPRRGQFESLEDRRMLSVGTNWISQLGGNKSTGVSLDRVLDWTRQIGSATHDGSRGVSADAQGNVYVVDSNIRVSHGGSYDVVVKKYNTSGVEQWTTQFCSNNSDTARSISVDGHELQLKKKSGVVVDSQDPSYDSDSLIATWTFASELPSDKLAIHLNDQTITDASGNRLDGDYNGDSLVDYGDDGPNGDGYENGSDSKLGTNGSELGVTVGAPPQITDVVIRGSLSLHADFSFDTVDGSGTQLATVPVGGADTVSIVFSEGVSVTSEMLTVLGLTTGNVPQLAEFSYDSVTFTATWRFDGWTLADNYLLTVRDGITDLEGNYLDGEWTNPASITTTSGAVSTFPSGDGIAGGVFQFAMTLLPGDANLDGRVDGYDYSYLSLYWNHPWDIDFQQADFNGDGTVNGNDFTLLAINFNTSLRDIWALADLDGDYDIDGDDLDVISDNLGMTSATWADGDLDGDGVVTLDDLDLAFLQYGLGFDLVA